MEFSHFNEEGRARIVDVTDKEETIRIAEARGIITMKRETLKLIEENKIAKGDVLSVAQVAGIMAAKETWRIIPMCHPLQITSIDIKFYINKELSGIEITSRVKLKGKTGVEMEALTAASAASLTIYDMCKAVDKGMVIRSIELISKCGGKSGSFTKEECKLGKIVAVNISNKKGEKKSPIEIGEVIENFGLKGDAHGGNWHRQISLLAQESIDKMRASGLYELTYGDFAENITTEGIVLHKLPIGTRLKIGDVLLEVTQIGKECHNGCAIKEKVGKCIMPLEGIFAKVITGGKIMAGEIIEVL